MIHCTEVAEGKFKRGIIRQQPSWWPIPAVPRPLVSYLWAVPRPEPPLLWLEGPTDPGPVWQPGGRSWSKDLGVFQDPDKAPSLWTQTSMCRENWEIPRRVALPLMFLRLFPKLVPILTVLFRCPFPPFPKLPTVNSQYLEQFQCGTMASPMVHLGMAWGRHCGLSHWEHSGTGRRRRYAKNHAAGKAVLQDKRLSSSPRKCHYIHAANWEPLIHCTIQFSPWLWLFARRIHCSIVQAAKLGNNLKDHW